MKTMTCKPKLTDDTWHDLVEALASPDMEKRPEATRKSEKPSARIRKKPQQQ
jgi:hypothetical protein